MALLSAGRCPFRAWQQDVATRALGPGMDRVRGEDGVSPRIKSKLSWRCGAAPISEADNRRLSFKSTGGLCGFRTCGGSPPELATRRRFPAAQSRMGLRGRRWKGYRHTSRVESHPIGEGSRVGRGRAPGHKAESCHGDVAFLKSKTTRGCLPTFPNRTWKLWKSGGGGA